MTRRELMRAGAVLGAGSALAACGGVPKDANATLGPAEASLDAIEHVVFLMMENRSFDHYYGSLGGVRGFDDHPKDSPGVFAQSWPAGVASKANAKLLPWHLDVHTMDAACIVSPDHEWGPQHDSYNNGQLAFLQSEVNALGTKAGPLTMGYYTRSDLPFYYALAEGFTVLDGYYSSVIGPTHPNRLYSISGMIDPDGLAGGPIVTTSVENFHKASWATVQEVMLDSGIDWKVYNPQGPLYGGSDPAALIAGNNPLSIFKQYKLGTTLYSKAFDTKFPKDFQADVANNSLPPVSWVWPGAVPSYDDHPSGSAARGQYMVNSILRTIWSNPAVWAKTMVLLTYDENGGFFDHVVPPVPPPGTPGEYLTVNPLPKGASGIASPLGLGFRVPTIMISPWTRGGYVCSDTFDHTSQLMFLEKKFGITAPNITPWRRQNVGDLTSTLRMNAFDPSIPPLPDAPKTPDYLKTCSAVNLDSELGGSTPAPPQQQQMPVQEPGTLKRVGATAKPS